MGQRVDAAECVAGEARKRQHLIAVCVSFALTNTLDSRACREDNGEERREPGVHGAERWVGCDREYCLLDGFVERRCRWVLIYD